MQKARRRLLIASSALLAPATLLAQSRPSKVARIGWLGAGGGTVGTPSLSPFTEGLRELNYVEGRDYVLEMRLAGGDIAKLPALAMDLVQKQVDVIVAAGTLPAQAAKAATTVIPIVAAGVADLAESGLVASLARPGGNVTGVAVAFPETAAKQLEIMREVIPQGKRAAVLWAGKGPENAFFERQRRAMEATKGVELTWYSTRLQRELQSMFQAIQKSRPDFLVVLSDSFYFVHRAQLVKLAADARIPAIYGFREYVDDGGLISYGASLADSLKGAGGYVGRILGGAKPADLPVWLPSRLELVVNANTARALGLQIPRSVLARADMVVK